jgi:hypothetical protein
MGVFFVSGIFNNPALIVETAPWFLAQKQHIQQI